MLVHSFNQLNHIHNKLAKKSGPCLLLHLLPPSSLILLQLHSHSYQSPKCQACFQFQILIFVFTIWNLFPQIFSWLTHSLTLFRLLLRCYLLKEVSLIYILIFLSLFPFIFFLACMSTYNYIFMSVYFVVCELQDDGTSPVQSLLYSWCPEHCEKQY